MKPQAFAVLPQLADLHPGSFAPSARAARPTGPSIWQRIATWRRVARQRRQLRSLDPRLLQDIGLSPEQAHQEATRPFWDIDPRR